MPSITHQHRTAIEIAGGVDTHLDTHTAAVIDQIGRVLGTATFPADAAGYAALLAWMCGFGHLTRIGIEGTGVYGAGLALFLREHDIDMVEVDRPDPRHPDGSSAPDPTETTPETGRSRPCRSPRHEITYSPNRSPSQWSTAGFPVDAPLPPVGCQCQDFHRDALWPAGQAAADTEYRVAGVEAHPGEKSR